MRGGQLVWLVWASVVLNHSDLIAGDAEPAILQNSPDFAHLRPSRLEADPRQRLSSSQQQQILSDVQQHQRRYSGQPSRDNNPQLIAFPGQNFPTSSKAELSEQSNFPSLAKYRVDRAKQQQQQQQQQQSSQTDTINFPQLRQQRINVANGQQRYLEQLTARRENDGLDEYYEKQRQLELIKRQREQLIMEQREIKRQQELLRQQELRRLTSTTVAPPTSIRQSSSPTNYATSPSPLLLSSPTARRITPAESELFLKAIATHQKKFTTTTTTTEASRARQERVEDSSGGAQVIPKDILSLIQAQRPQLLAARGNDKPKINIIYETDEGKATSGASNGQQRSTASPTRSYSASDNDLLLKQLKLALARSADNDEKNIATRDLVLPNGKKLQVIQSPNGLSSIIPENGSSQFQTVSQALKAATSPPTTTTTTTIRPANAILDELTKGVLPPGADFEVLRHKDDGKLEEVGKSPIHNQPGKKVTFVVLEEQPDGSYKVQGVRGNAEKDNGVDVHSIVEKIKKGELKLPPSNNSPVKSTSRVVLDEKESTTAESTRSSTLHARDNSATVTTTYRPTTVEYSASPSTYGHRQSSSSSGYSPYATVSPNAISPSENYATSASTTSSRVYNALSDYEDDRASSRYTTAAATGNVRSSSRIPFASSLGRFNEPTSSTSSPSFYSSTSAAFPRTTSYVHFLPSNPTSTPRSAVTITDARYTGGSAASENLVLDDFQLTSAAPNFLRTNQPNLIATQQESMANLLRREGLFAMAKYLRQSGLDSVLNETGPYTIFVPTDKAFRTLLVQLGGPDRAEQKFRENPRLLSGLLLHHVIPGAFRIDSLQDEMTGVSLAGTQLRVNVYEMHDHEWNDVKVTTVNGAKVAPNKRDIELPQGIAHAIDRVMFPLPVGDIAQTLQADRERRFSTFLKILHASGLEDTLAGTKTFTVFAPTDVAFANAASQNNNRPVWIDSDGPEAAKEIISRHVIPSTLYTSGMRYYHQRETLRPGVTVNLQKSAGRVRVNEAQVVTNNVPATNGVLHAIDAVL